MERIQYISEKDYYLSSVDFLQKKEQSRELGFAPESTFQKDRKVVQYELEFDRQQAREVIASRGEDDYESRVENFTSFVEMQLLTALGERYNRGLSRYSYRVADGVLYGEHGDEPFIEVLERGRAYREQFGNPADQARESAEVVGFQKIQNILGREETPVGTIMISVSPPGGEGSIYKHNFYDGFRKGENGNIEVARFSSALTAEETVSKLQEIDPDIKMPVEKSDVSLLANPILLSSDTAQKMTLDSLHEHLHEDHEVMSEQDFEEVRKICAFLIVSYINALLEDPEDLSRHAQLYNALLNKADEAAYVLKENRENISLVRNSYDMSESEIYYLGMQEVRAVDTGCGFSGGVEVESALGAYSVAQFGGYYAGESMEDSLGSRIFTCPEITCGKVNIRPVNGMLERCAYCLSDKVSCKPGDTKNLEGKKKSQ